MITEREFKQIAKYLIKASFPHYSNEPELLLLEDNIIKALFSVHKDTTKFDIDHLVDQFQLVDKEK